MIARVVLAVMLVASLHARAGADDVVAYEVEGDAPTSAPDARQAAVDDAFARAVAAAIGELVPGDAHVAHKGELDRELIGHARLWVASYAVTRDETNDDRRQLVVSVRIDRDKLRDKLAKLGVATQDTAPAPVADTARPVIILLRVATPAGARASWGTGDVDVPGLAAAGKALRDAGFAVKRVMSGNAPPSAQGDLPIDDAGAASAADGAKAELALVAGVTIGGLAPVRGQAQPAGLVTAHLRLLDHGKLVAQGSALAAARGDDADAQRYAVDRALAAALADVLPPAPKKLAQAGGFRGDDTPLGDPGVVLVRLPPQTPWHAVLDEQKYLANSKGVRAATLRRLSPSGWVIGVATAESIDRVAQIAKRPPATDTSASVKIAGGIVEVTLTGAP